jgi:hypothetical protein
VDDIGECAVTCFEDSNEVVLHLIIRDYKNLPIVTHSGVADEDGYLANKVIPQITKLEETVPKTGISRTFHTQGDKAYLTCVYRYKQWPSSLGGEPRVRVHSMGEWPLPQGADIVKDTKIKIVRGITYDRYNRVTTPLTRVAVRALDTGPGTDCAGYTRET